MDTSLLATVIDECVEITGHIKYKTMVENYKQAIDILDEIGGDYSINNSIITRIARNNPDILVDAYNHVKYSNNDEMKKEVIRLINSNLYIQAIKLVREKTGWKLRDAKAYCDDLRDNSCSQR